MGSPGAPVRRLTGSLCLVLVEEATTVPTFPGALYVLDPPGEPGRLREGPELTDEEGRSVVPFVALVEPPLREVIRVEGTTLHVHPDAVVHVDPDQPVVLTGYACDDRHTVTAVLPFRSFLVALDHARHGPPDPYELFEVFAILYDPIQAAAFTLNARGHALLIDEHGVNEHAMLYTTPPGHPGPDHISSRHVRPSDLQGAPKHVTGDGPPILPRDRYLDLLARTQLITGVPEPGRADFRLLENVHEYVRPLLTTIHLAHHWETRQVHEETGRLVAEILRGDLHREVADAHKRAVRALGSRYPTPAYAPDARVRWARQLAGPVSDRVLTKVQDFARLVACHRLVNRLWTFVDTVTLLGYEECVDLVEMAYSYTEHDLPGHEIERLLRPWIDALRDPHYRRLERGTAPPPKLRLVEPEEPEDLLVCYDRLL
ncbi:hypothetical protein [Methanopyrus kandleri]|uniref:Uncharacterized protein n=1 Tax=Methanopyrus kandleri TaxID=2320 RepID=A0A832TF02_9EURY|nr:hypothetical protein [Methanopyrus kandleri]HII69734.1 hypothetical protein [Methanopyrus kandleri]